MVKQQQPDDCVMAKRQDWSNKNSGAYPSENMTYGACQSRRLRRALGPHMGRRGPPGGGKGATVPTARGLSSHAKALGRHCQNRELWRTLSSPNREEPWRTPAGNRVQRRSYCTAHLQPGEESSAMQAALEYVLRCCCAQSAECAERLMQNTAAHARIAKEQTDVQLGYSEPESTHLVRLCPNASASDHRTATAKVPTLNWRPGFVQPIDCPENQQNSGPSTRRPV
ncbi:unnamed protein product [Prorocentrum cordatum]|uniref:Uncharacterized protein n=2 Tax=Prorocentrum cordatum TaxID=2364126 RepID=A0ABN9SPR0_9DINO|nr:unnamed protein product [Polarella glacialis]